LNKKLNLQGFADLLIGYPVIPPSGVLQINQASDGKVLYVPKVKTLEYEPLYCWYNCKSHASKNGGEVIFGWALFF